MPRQERRSLCIDARMSAGRFVTRLAAGVLLSVLAATPMLSQMTTAEKEAVQKRNLKEVGELLGTPRQGAPMLRVAPANTQLVQLKVNSDKLKAMSEQVNLAPRAQKAARQKELALFQLHAIQEERQTPALNDTTPDKLVELAFKKQGLSPVLYQVLLWNHAALDVTSVDHTSVPAGQDASLYPQYAEQVGPPCSSRALAIVHLAMFEALNLIEKKYPGYRDAKSSMTVGDASLATLHLKASDVSGVTADENSAVEYAGYVTLVKLYPYLAGYFAPKWKVPSDGAIAAGVTGANASARITLGRRLGTAVAEEVVQERANDTSQLNGRCFIGDSIDKLPHTGPGYSSDAAYIWQVDPIHADKLVALGSEWKFVRPWVLQHAEQYRPAKVDTTTGAFRDDYELVRVVGGDPNAVVNTTPMHGSAPTHTERTNDQTQSAIFWAYDASPGLCAPPRLYNMVVTSIATHERPVTDPVEMARLLALANVAMADAGIAAWEAKFYYRFARPITTYRTNTQYKTWTPLGAQITNTNTVNLTPPFPAFPSGHATFGGALFQVLRDFYGVTDEKDIPFRFVSDEWNGINLDPKTGQPRPLRPRWYSTLSQAESENAMSRIYLGIHWKNDADAGTHQGNCVGNFVGQGLYTGGIVSTVANCN